MGKGGWVGVVDELAVVVAVSRRWNAPVRKRSPTDVPSRTAGGKEIIRKKTGRPPRHPASWSPPASSLTTTTSGARAVVSVNKRTAHTATRAWNRSHSGAGKHPFDLRRTRVENRRTVRELGWRAMKTAKKKQISSLPPLLPLRISLAIMSRNDCVEAFRSVKVDAFCDFFVLAIAGFRSNLRN